MESPDSMIRQVLVRLLDGKHRFLNFDVPAVSVADLKQRIQNLTAVAPCEQLLLIDNSKILHDDQILILGSQGKRPEKIGAGCNSGDNNIVRLRFRDAEGSDFSRNFPVVVNLLLRLRGGKGGFGSLLRGAASKAGQKKTNNFDACRDMSGRRLRHVNAEKKLEEWKAGEEERKLEKMAEEFLRRKTKEGIKSGKAAGAESAEKYVAKYREVSEKCVERVETAVRQSVKGLEDLKRKKDQSEKNGSASKRLKIWFGKRKLGDSDSDYTDEEEEEEEQPEENEKSVIIDGNSHSDSSKEKEGSSSMVAGGQHDEESVDQGSGSSGAEEENVADKTTESGTKENASGEACINGYTAASNFEHQDHHEVAPEMTQNSHPNDLNGIVSPQSDSNFMAKSVLEESVHDSEKPQDLPNPLNLNEYNTAAELEVLGLEQLKLELSSRGLKCGGTLQERAARLFLLKTTPLEKLPKKLFSKK